MGKGNSGLVVRRVSGVVAKPAGDEVFVFDPATDRMHALNPAAAAVFEACDDTRTPEAIAARLADKDLSFEAVQLGLVELSEAGLVEFDAPIEAPSRRELLKKIGAGAAAVAAIPVIESIIAPTAAAAASATAPSPTPVPPTPTPAPVPIADINNEADLRKAAAAGGAYTVTTTPIVLTGGHVVVSKRLTLSSVGPGNATINANRTSRGFLVWRGSLTLTDITVTGGTARFGGGIRSRNGHLTLTGTTLITGNTARNGGGIDNAWSTLTMNGGSVSGNTAYANGGGISNNFGGTVTMNGGSIDGNRATSAGGGIFNLLGKTKLNGGSITNNTARNGGGISNWFGKVDQNGTSITGNHPDDCLGC